MVCPSFLRRFLGHLEAVKLISSSKYLEKRMGYLAVSLLKTDNPELLDLITEAIISDLVSARETDICLALCAIANMDGTDLAQKFCHEISKLLEGNENPFIRKKACLCLLRLFRLTPDAVPVHEWADMLLPLMKDSDMVRMFFLRFFLRVCCWRQQI